jgi:serine/threonine protein kinase
MEFCKLDLGQVIQHSKDLPLRPGQAKNIMHQLFNGLNVLHKNHFIHRDIKPINCLVDGVGIVKLCDFGCARKYGAFCGRLTPNMVSGHYRSPELLLALREYGGGVDMWAMGCIFAELLQRDALWKGKHELDQLAKITETLGHPSPETWPEYDRLYQKAFGRSPNNKAPNARVANIESDHTKSGAKVEANSDDVCKHSALKSSCPGTSENDSEDDFATVFNNVTKAAAESESATSYTEVQSDDKEQVSEQSSGKLAQQFVALRKKFSKYGYDGTGKLPSGLRKLSTGPKHVTTRVTSLCDKGFDLLCSCFAMNPKDRISATKALHHPYFKCEEPQTERLGATLLRTLKARHDIQVQQDKVKKNGNQIGQNSATGFSSGFSQSGIFGNSFASAYSMHQTMGMGINMPLGMMRYNTGSGIGVVNASTFSPGINRMQFQPPPPAMPRQFITGAGLSPVPNLHAVRAAAVAAAKMMGRS